MPLVKVFLTIFLEGLTFWKLVLRPRGRWNSWIIFFRWTQFMGCVCRSWPLSFSGFLTRPSDIPKFHQDPAEPLHGMAFCQPPPEPWPEIRLPKKQARDTARSWKTFFRSSLSLYIYIHYTWFISSHAWHRIDTLAFSWSCRQPTLVRDSGCWPSLDESQQIAHFFFCFCQVFAALPLFEAAPNLFILEELHNW